MASGQGNAAPKGRRRKASSATEQLDVAAPAPARRKKLKAKAPASCAREEEEQAHPATQEEELNPGMLLMDFINEPAAAGRKAARSTVKRGKVGKKVKAKRPATGDSSDGEGDLLSFGQTTSFDGGDEAGASAKLISAISAAGTTRAASAMRPRHAEESIPENEFHAGAAGDEITIEDLLAPMAESKGFADVKKQLQGLSKKEAMAEPMSDPKQGREERQTRYDVTAKDIGKFIPQVQRMRKADQIHLGEQKDLRPETTSALVGTFRPQDDFEKELEAVTKAAGATEADFIDQKGLPMNPRIRDHQQTQTVARLKALMLREQQASKRIKKIKSKTYHRIHRKSEHKEREVLLDRLERDNPELAKSLKQDYEKKHAERRLQRGRNARQKWAKTMQRFAKGSESAAQEITNQAQLARDESQALRRVIQGKEADQSEDSEAMDLTDSDNEGGSKGLARRTVDKAKKFTLNELKNLKEGGDLPTTGLLGMSFMRNAIRQKRDDAKAEAKSVLNELEGLGAKLDCDDDEAAAAMADMEGTVRDKAADSLPAKKVREFTAEELEQASKDVDSMFEQEDVTQSKGMSVSGPLTVRGVEAQALPQRQTLNAAASSSSAPGASIKTNAPARASGRQAAPDSDNPWTTDAAGENPWLAADAVPDAATPSASSAPAAERKKARSKGAAASAEPGSKRKRRRGRDDSVERASDGEAGEAEAPSTSPAELLNVLDADAEAARQQRDLVRATFVEGTQAEDFDDEKDEKLREKEDKDKPVELVGWGSWTGTGAPKPRPKPAPKAKASFQPKDTRHDTPKPSHVQHYEGDAALKAQAKYFVDKVPYPFKNPQQYNQEMRMPSGPEWNTLNGHLGRIKPKVFVKTGAVVAPLAYIKHLPAEQQESAMNTWGRARQPKRLKARF